MATLVPANRAGQPARQKLKRPPPLLLTPDLSAAVPAGVKDVSSELLGGNIDLGFTSSSDDESESPRPGSSASAPNSSKWSPHVKSAFAMDRRYSENPQQMACREGSEPMASPAESTFPSVCDGQHRVDVGPLHRGKVQGVDAHTVYVRLTNFAMRRRGLKNRGLTSNATERCLEPLTPLNHHTFGNATSCSSRCASPVLTPRNVRLPPVIAERSPCHRAAAPLAKIGSCTASAELQRKHPNWYTTWNAADKTETAEAHEAEEIMRIQQHLEEMNAAAAELNNAQASLAACMRDKVSLLQVWAVGSAEMARLIGPRSLVKAAPYYGLKRRSEASREVVMAASARFKRAMESGASDRELVTIVAEHARGLAEYEAIKRDLATMNLEGGPSGKALKTIAAVAPYFEAEDEHRFKVAKVEATLNYFTHWVDGAKARYHKALRSLEAVSEQAHRRRSNDGDLSEPKRSHAV